MSFDATNLLLSLAHAMSESVFARDGVAITLGEDLFVHDLPASASSATGAHAVLRIYGGPVEDELLPVPALSVQCMVYADDCGQGLDLAHRLYEALHDPDNSERPRQTWSIDSKKLDAGTGDVIDDASIPEGWDIRLIVLISGMPGVIGRGDASSGGGAGGGRWQISFNFDVRVSSLPED